MEGYTVTYFRQSVTKGKVFFLLCLILFGNDTKSTSIFSIEHSQQFIFTGKLLNVESLDRKVYMFEISGDTARTKDSSPSKAHTLSCVRTQVQVPNTTEHHAQLLHERGDGAVESLLSFFPCH